MDEDGLLRRDAPRNDGQNAFDAFVAKSSRRRESPDTSTARVPGDDAEKD
jgi:hypothetical protein